MTRGCVEGLVQRWTFFVWPIEDDDDRRPGIPPAEGDIGVVASTGSCYLVKSIKPSRRKGRHWYTVHVEGLGLDAAELGDDGTFPLGHLSHADHERIRAIEHAERIERGEVSTVPSD